jgi:uncharacterized membrane protein
MPRRRILSAALLLVCVTIRYRGRRAALMLPMIAQLVVIAILRTHLNYVLERQLRRVE